MSKVLIRYRDEGFRDVLRHPAVLARLRSLANAKAAQAGPGFRVKASIGKNRASAVVIAVTAEARRAEAEDKVLTKARGN